MAKTPVTRETYCRAETDRTFFNTLRMTGGVNRFFCFRQVTPLDKQTVVRMNKDTLYAAAIVDTAKGASITVPPMPDGRYCSVMLVDNDHYSAGVIYTAGRHPLPQDTKYLGLLVRIQLLRRTIRRTSRWSTGCRTSSPSRPAVPIPSRNRRGI